MARDLFYGQTVVVLGGPVSFPVGTDPTILERDQVILMRAMVFPSLSWYTMVLTWYTFSGSCRIRSSMEIACITTTEVKQCFWP